MIGQNDVPTNDTPTEKDRLAREDRNHGLDLLRIVSMCFIVITHFLQKGGVLDSVVFISFDYSAAWILRAIAYTSVSCYFLITGFYLCDKAFKIDRLIKIVLEVTVFSTVIYLVDLVFLRTPFNVSSLFKAIFPVLFRQYGFVNNYILLILLSPLLNLFVRSSSRLVHFSILVILVIVCSILPILVFFDVFNIGGGEGFLWISLLYLSAAYYKKYCLKDEKAYKYLLFGLSLCLLQFCTKIVIARITLSQFGEVKYSSAFYGETPIFSFLSSLSFFIGFNLLHIKNGFTSKVISFISSSVFAVYLFHENPFIREKLWAFISPSQYLGTYKLYVCLFVVVLAFFVISISFDKIRIFVEKRIKLVTHISNIFNKLFEKIKCYFLKKHE